MCRLNASQLSFSLSRSGHDTEERGGHHKKCVRELLDAESIERPPLLQDRGACAGRSGSSILTAVSLRESRGPCSGTIPSMTARPFTLS
ncbi:hypothetical protein SRHO_G00166530 [Serrasalmus rhombeus]